MNRKVLLMILSFLTAGIGISSAFVSLLRTKEDTEQRREIKNSEKFPTIAATPTISVSDLASRTDDTLMPYTTNTPTPAKAADDFVFLTVDKNNSIGQFVPPELTMIPTNYSTRSIQVTKRILPDLIRMINAAAREGVDLKVVSGYRSYADQSIIFNSYVQQEMNKDSKLTRPQAEGKVNMYSAYPGYSEHQLGTTVDILSKESNYTFDTNDSMKFVQWLNQNSVKYNFYISYPKDNGMYQYEPWHVRWKP